MPYIDEDYYLNVYKGKAPTEDIDLSREIEQASDLVDTITNFQLKYGNAMIWLGAGSFINDQVKKATAIITENFIINGGYEALRLKNSGSNNLSSVSLSGFSYSKGNNTEGKSQVELEVPELAISHLSSTGLLYRGVNWV